MKEVKEIIREEAIREEIRKLKDKDQLKWNLILQKHADFCLRFRYFKILFPRLVDSFENAMYYDVPGLPFKTKIDKYETEMHAPFYYETRILMNNRDIWYNAVKREGLMDDLRYKYALKRFDFLIQLLAQYGGLQEVKGFVEEGIDTAIHHPD